MLSVRLSESELRAEGSAEATVSYSNLESGLAGYEFDVTVSDPSVARITGASATDALDKTASPSIDDDGSSVTLAASAAPREATDTVASLDLATVRVEAVGEGTARIDVAVDAVRTADGASVRPRVEAAELSIAAPPGDGAASGPVVSIEPAASRIDPGEETTATVTASNVTGGLAGYQVDVTTNPKVVRITGASHAGPPPQADSSEVSPDGSYVSLGAAGAGAAAGDLERAELATVTLEGVEAGETALGVAVESFETAGGDGGAPATEATTVTVGARDAGGDEPVVSIEPVATDVVAGSTAASVSLSNLANGLESYELDVTSTDPDAVRIAAADVSERLTPAERPAVAADGSAARLTATDAAGSVTGDVANVELATLRLDATGDGTSTIGFAIESIADEDGRPLEPIARTATVSAGAAADREPTGPALTIDPASAALGGGSTTATIALKNLPNGIAGYELSVTSSDPDAVEIDGAAYTGTLDPTTSPVLAPDGSSVTLGAIDRDREHRDSVSRVELARVSLTAVGEGTSTLAVSVDRIDAHGGTLVDPWLGATTVAAGTSDGRSAGSDEEAIPGTADGAVAVQNLGGGEDAPGDEDALGGEGAPGPAGPDDDAVRGETTSGSDAAGADRGRERPEIAVDVADGSIDVGDVTTATVTVDPLDPAVAGRAIEVALDVPVAEIIGAEYAGEDDGRASPSVADDGTAATVVVQGTDGTGDGPVPGDRDVDASRPAVRVATLSLEGVAEGSTTLDATVAAKEDDDASARVDDGTLWVSAAEADGSDDDAGWWEDDGQSAEATPEAPDEPIAELRPDATAVEVGERVAFSVEDASGPEYSVAELAWAFGDGTTATGWWNAHRFDAPGRYAVTLTATARNGATTTHTVTIDVSE